MKTIIEYKDGGEDHHPDKLPTFDVEGDDGPCVTLCDDSMTVYDEVPLNLVKRVVFEP